MSARIIILAVALTFGCTRKTPEAEKQVLPFKPKDAQIKAGIRAVDFANFTYFPECNAPEPVMVENGTIQNIKKINGLDEAIDENMPNYFDVQMPIYGDLDGDGKEEAVIESLCNTGGTGQFSEGYIFAMKDGKPVLVARIEGGDRGMGGIADLKIVENRLIVTRNESTTNCCAKFTATARYRLQSNKLVAIGIPDRKKAETPD